MVSSLILGLALSAATAAEPEAAKPAEADQAAYESARAAAGRDADAHVALALWCEAHGMPAEKATHLARAVLLDPSHAKARGLLGYVRHDGKWMRPEEVSKAVEESPEAQALFREYQQRRVKARDRADDQYKLARWCDERGLEQQATAHYHRVVELDPGRESAWKHLGFKKVSGRWIKPEALAAEKAEREAQEKADRFWKPKLEHLKAVLSGRGKAQKAEAEEALAAIVDPRAVPMVWNVFALGDEASQATAVRVLAQIDSPRASRALATIAMFSPSPVVRADASQSLLGRDPREYAELLVGLMRAEVKYKVKQVAGPGSQGELLIEGKEANVKRLYTPMSAPANLIAPGDVVSFDGNGMLVASRPLGLARIPVFASPGSDFTSFAALQTGPRPGFKATLSAAGLPAKVEQNLLASADRPLLMTEAARRWAASNPGSAVFAVAPILQDQLQIPVGRMIEEAKESATVARNQLAQDVQRIEDFNAPIREVNDRAGAILKNISGKDFGADSEKWAAWAVDLKGYAVRSGPAPSTPPTYLEEVPLAYQPQAGPVVVEQAVGQIIATHACFAAGTVVHTLQGDRPIESIQPGDQLLSQDTSTGAFRYRPVVTAYHNPPNETYRLDLGGESIVATGIHRFWKAGRGWIMAREVKAGDRLRTVGGSVEVVAVEKDKVQPVYNLRLDGGDDFCVGESGVIAHDNSFVEPVDRPFDVVPALAAAGPAGAP